MHIAHFTNTYHPVISGVVRSVSDFRTALTELGHNVFVFAQYAPDFEDQEPFIFRYPAINIPAPAEFPATIPISPFVDRLLPALKPDVIHTHHPFLLGQAAATKAEELDLPLVFTFHTQYREYSHYFPLSQEIVQEFVKDAIENWLADFMRQCQHIVVPSESMRAKLVESYGLKERLTVIPTGIDLRPYLEADGTQIRAERGWQEDQVIISVGRLAPEKNWGRLLEATGHALKSNPRLRLALIGDGPQKKELKRQAAKLGIESRVEFAGKLPFKEIPRYLKAADLFGFASLTETQGLVTMEALAAGLPVVAVDATGTRDVIEQNVQGLLTSDDAIELGDAIATVLGEADRLERYREAAHVRVQEFDILKTAQRLVSVYEQAGEDKAANQYVDVPVRKRLFPLQ